MTLLLPQAEVSALGQVLALSGSSSSTGGTGSTGSTLALPESLAASLRPSWGLAVASVEGGDAGATGRIALSDVAYLGIEGAQVGPWSFGMQMESRGRWRRCLGMRDMTG